MSDGSSLQKKKIFMAWDRIRGQSSRDPDAGGLYKVRAFEFLDRHYGSPERTAHGWVHILDLLEKNQAFQANELLRSLAARPNLIDHAILWHDVIRITQNREGILRSGKENAADSAKAFLDHSRMSSADNNAIVAMITATGNPLDLPPSLNFYKGFMQDRALIVDFDLSALAGEPDVVDQAGFGLRQAYSATPEKVFWQAQAEVLVRFAAAAPLYKTPALEEAWGAQARENIARGMTQLSERIAPFNLRGAVNPLNTSFPANVDVSDDLVLQSKYARYARCDLRQSDPPLPAQ